MMRLEDLPRINELAAALKRLDEFAGPAELAIGEMVMALDAEETADFVDWKRGRINAELRPLIDGAATAPDGGDQEPGIIREKNTQERSGTAREAASTRGERIGKKSRSKPRSVGTQSAAPHHRMTRAAALTEARRRILGPFEAELRARGGGLGDASEVSQDLEIYADKRSTDIADLAKELMRGPRVATCCVCGNPATTVIAGKDYCTKDAKGAPRMEPAAEMRLVA